MPDIVGSCCQPGSQPGAGGREVRPCNRAVADAKWCGPTPVLGEGPKGDLGWSRDLKDKKDLARLELGQHIRQRELPEQRPRGEAQHSCGAGR